MSNSATDTYYNFALQHLVNSLRYKKDVLQNSVNISDHD